MPVKSAINEITSLIELFGKLVLERMITFLMICGKTNLDEKEIL
jgi:hypothetical protein